MNKNRLLKLASFLENLPPKKFDLDTFTHIQGNKLPSIKEGSCGSTACGIGWCPTVFPRLCKYQPLYDQYSYEDDIIIGVDIVMRDDSVIEGFFVSNELFDILYDDSNYLFNPQCYHKSKRGPKSVANRIRTYVLADGKVPINTKAYRGDFDE